jgi:hypothetical protein
MAAAIEWHEIIAERDDMGREKARGADVEIHLVAVAIHGGAVARPVGCIIGSVERVRWRRYADEFSAHEKLLDYKQTTPSGTKNVA